MFHLSTCSCLYGMCLSQVLSREWRCSWSSADRRCSNYIWGINNLIAYESASSIRDLTVIHKMTPDQLRDFYWLNLVWMMVKASILLSLDFCWISPFGHDLDCENSRSNLELTIFLRMANFQPINTKQYHNDLLERMLKITTLTFDLVFDITLNLQG